MPKTHPAPEAPIVPRVPELERTPQHLREAGIAELRAYRRRYPLSRAVAERDGWTASEARSRAIEAGQRILDELREGVTMGGDEDAEGAAYIIVETSSPSLALVELGQVLLRVVREGNGTGLTSETVAVLEERLAELEREGSCS